MPNVLGRRRGQRYDQWAPSFCQELGLGLTRHEANAILKLAQSGNVDFDLPGGQQVSVHIGRLHRPAMSIWMHGRAPAAPHQGESLQQPAELASLG